MGKHLSVRATPRQREESSGVWGVGCVRGCPTPAALNCQGVPVGRPLALFFPSLLEFCSIALFRRLFWIIFKSWEEGGVVRLRAVFHAGL